MKAQAQTETYEQAMQQSSARREDSPQRDSLLDNSDLQMIRDESYLRETKKVAFQNGGKKGKQKMKLVYQVQKVIKIPVYEQRNKVDVSGWNSTLPDNYNKFRQSKSVKPRQRFKATLPAVLNEPSIFIDEASEIDKSVTPTQKQHVQMQSLKRKANFTRKNYQRELSEQREATIRDSTMKRNYRKAMSVFHDIQLPRSQRDRSPMSFNNPQHEAQQRQQSILEEIKHVSVPRQGAKKVKPSNGKLYILKDRSGQLSSGLGDPSERLLSFQQPSTSGQIQPVNNSMQQSQQQDQQGTSSIIVAPVQQVQVKTLEPVETVPVKPVPVQAKMKRRESTALTMKVSREHILPVSPRQLVSEEGGIVNLITDNEFDAPTTKIRHKKLKVVNVKRTKQLDKEYDSARLSPDNRYLSTAGTGPLCSKAAFNHRKGTVDETKPGKKEHARFLVELMAPFASRAGTQGITSVSNRSISQNNPHLKGGRGGTFNRRPEYHVTRLSPINKAMLQQQSQRNELLPSPQLQQVLNAQVHELASHDYDEDRSSVGKQKSPFRQLAYDNSSDYHLSRNHFKSVQTAPHDQQNDGFTTRGSYYPQTNDSVVVQTADGGARNTALNEKSCLQKRLLNREKMSLNNPSSVHLDHDKLPFMTMNSSVLATQRKQQVPEAIDERVKRLPLNIQREISDTQKLQLYQFYEAMLQPSTIPFTQQDSVAHVTPKIGDKVSMLRNVRETLTKRYQLAKAARIEASRRLKLIERIRMLRLFIAFKVNYKPMRDMQCQKSLLLERITYTEPYLVNEDLWETCHELYVCREMSRQIAAAYQLQTWIRMQLKKNFYKKTIRRFKGVQRLWKQYKIAKQLKMIQYELKQKCVLLLQRQMRGYLAYQQYYARLKGTMTVKNLDYIITRYADAKDWMRDCLQIQLAYLTRKMIKRKAIQAAIDKKKRVAEKKRIKEEKERERLRKIHEERKAKKREVRKMLIETVHICWQKEDKRREDQLAKDRKKQATAIVKKQINKVDIPMDAVTLAFGQELFDGCYKRIIKRISAAKKKAKANKDLKGVSKQLGSKKSSSIVSDLKRKTTNIKEVSPGTSPSSKKAAAAAAEEAEGAQKGPSLDPHHLQLIQIGRKIKMIKYDKHPNGKLRRNYKDQVSIECTLDCIAKENEKFAPDIFSQGDKSSRAVSKQSASRQQTKAPLLNKGLTKRMDTPEVLNISVGAAMGETSFELPGTTGTVGENGEIKIIQKRNTIAFVQRTADTIDDIRLASNDDLDMFADDPDASATSEELSDNSETYDFLMVYMPFIRPKEPDSNEEEKPVKIKKESKSKKGGGPGLKSKKTLRKGSKSFITPSLENNLVDISSGDGGMPMTSIQRAQSLNQEPQVIQLGQLDSGTDNDLSKQLNPFTVMDVIGEESVSALPPPNTPLAVIPSREDIKKFGKNNVKGKKGGKQKEQFTEFDKPFSQNGDQQMDEMEEIRIADEKGSMDDLIINQDIDPVIQNPPKDVPKKDPEFLQGIQGTLRIDGDDTQQDNGNQEEEQQKCLCDHDPTEDNQAAEKLIFEMSQTNLVEAGQGFSGSLEVASPPTLSHDGHITPQTEDQMIPKLQDSGILSLIKTEDQSLVTLQTTQGAVFKTQSEMIFNRERGEQPKIVMIQSTLAKDSSLDDSNYILDYRLDRNDNETNQEDQEDVAEGNDEKNSDGETSKEIDEKKEK